MDREGKNMNILFHAHEFNIKEGGPCTKRIDSLARYLSEKGHKVTIITSSHNKKTEGKIARNYKVIYSYSTKKIKKSTIHRLLNNVLFGITSFFKILVVSSKFDIVVTTSPPPLISIFGFWIAKIKHAKLVYDVRDIWPDVAIEMESFKKGSIYDKVFSFIAKFMYKHSDIITTVTPGKVAKIRKYVKGKEKEKVKYIPNGFDDNLIKFPIDMELVKKYDFENIFSIVYIGNIGLAQNLEALIQLAKEYQENEKIHFFIFGEGANRKSIENKIKELNLNNISVEGRVDYSNVLTILTYAKISFISLKNTNMVDSIPTKIFDAIGVGCPVILMARGDSCEILRNSELGESAENIEQLKVKFKYMLEHYKKYEEKREKAITYVKEEFSRKKIAQIFEEETLQK
ncbi:MAG: glycosyltransferase family 4 protein [Bacilli bacterium]|nr:glycosyltransferase family 4 protein [Bacilli bacterium]